MPTQTTPMPSFRAFSAKQIGNRPLPASNPIGAWSAMMGRGLLVLNPQLLLERPHFAAHLRQPLQRHQDALLLSFRSRRRPEHALASGHIFGHSRLGANGRPIAYVDVISNPDLAGDHHVVAR